INLASFLRRIGPSGLPTYRVLLGGHEHWFGTAADVDAFRRTEQERIGRELVVADESPERGGNGHVNGHAETFYVQEFHEVRGINRGLERLREFGLDASCLVDAPRVAGREPAPRFLVEAGDQRRVLSQLRELLPEIRRLGERGMAITRFKGL